MKRILIIPILFCIGSAVFAGPSPHNRRDAHKDPYIAEIDLILGGVENTVISDLTFGEVDALMEKISIPLQKAAYVRRSWTASMAIPGIGQFKNGNPLSGILFLAGDLVVVTGTIIGLYFLLPEELQFGQLNYFTTPAGDIKSAWMSAKESITLVEALPSIGVAAGGMLLHHGLKMISANHAAKLARGNIESGRVTFEPKSSFVSGRNARRLGVGVAMNF